MATASASAAGSWIDAEAAREAVAHVRPLFERAVAENTLGESGAAHVTVMHPMARFGVVSFTAAILYEESFGDTASWDADYAAFARAKAEVAWRTGCDSSVLATEYPHLLRKGDTLLAGAVCVHGITVGVSGMRGWYDSALAASVAAFMRAIMQEKAAALHGVPFVAAD